MSRTAQRFYVYGWYNHDWERWFYVGKGTGGRYNEVRKRSKDFDRIIGAYDCSAHILVQALDEQTALETEAALKATLWAMGEPIIDSEKNRAAQNQREGIERAKRAGKYRGPLNAIKINWKQFETEYKLWKQGHITARLAMEHTGLKPNTFYRRVKEYEEIHGSFVGV